LKSRKISDSEIIVLKLGGSLITRKDVALTVNRKAIARVARSIRKSKLPSEQEKLVLVHGGGSFGHYYAKQYNISTTFSSPKPMGIFRTNSAMLELNSEIRRQFDIEGVASESILPAELLDQNATKISASGITKLESCFCNKLIPLSFGYVLLSRSGARVVSGDEICEALAKTVKVKRIIFAMDVDGIHSTDDLKGEIIPVLTRKDSFFSSIRRFDITGGVRSKVALGFRLAKLGSKVFFVNGEKDDRLYHLLKGDTDVVATMIA
jgi:isopentenyl phosphate kinase